MYIHKMYIEKVFISCIFTDQQINKPSPHPQIEQGENGATWKFIDI